MDGVVGKVHFQGNRDLVCGEKVIFLQKLAKSWPKSGGGLGGVMHEGELYTKKHGKCYPSMRESCST